MKHLAVAALLFVLPGCALEREMTFRAVDAATGETITGVEATRHKYHWQPAAPGLFPVRVPWSHDALMTDSLGQVTFEAVQPGQTIGLQKRGYRRVSIARVWPWLSLSFIDEHGNKDPIDVQVIDDVVIVPFVRSADVYTSDVLPTDLTDAFLSELSP